MYLCPAQSEMFRSTLHNTTTHAAAEAAVALRPGAELLVIGTGFDSGKDLTFYIYSKVLNQVAWILSGFGQLPRDIIFVKHSEPYVKALSAAAGK